MNTMELLKAERVPIKYYRESISQNVNAATLKVITVNGQPKQVVIPYDDVLELFEMLEEMRDARLVGEVRDARAAYKETGKGVSARRIWEKYKKAR